ncbi:MAG: fibronectin type III domain-containing protein [Gemmatimonadetes bacterium]|nr:fibronectin type III domain-containing protein [Gemmatimonadota bacterium]
MLAVEGLRKADDELSSPPISAAELEKRVERMKTAAFAIQQWKEQGAELHHDMKDARTAVADGLTRVIRYSEVVFRDEPIKLGILGWGPVREKTPIKPPNEVRDIRIKKEGDTWIELAWKAPKGGGKVATYTIQQRKEGAAPWDDVHTTMDKQGRVEGRPRGVQLEFRVVAINRAGTGSPSGVVTAVL